MAGAIYATFCALPSVQQLLVSKPGNVLSQITIDPQTVFLLMTHNYNYDLAMLRAVVIEVCYL